MILRAIVLIFPCLFLAAAICPAAEGKFPLLTFESDPPGGSKLTAIVADGENRAWGIGDDRRTVLYLLKGEIWTTVSPPDFPAELEPLLLEVDHQGNLLCLWKEKSTEEDLVLSCHDPANHTLLSRIPIKLKDPNMIPLRSGGVLLSGSGPELVKCGIEGEAPEVLILPEDAFTAPNKRKDGTIDDDYLPLRAFEDTKGELWIWSQSMKPSSYLWRLTAPVILNDADQMSPIDLPIKPKPVPVSLIGATGKDTLSICVAGTGLFSVNSATGKKQAVQSDELKHVERIFSAGGYTYMLATPKPSKVDIEMSETFRSTLEMTKTIFYDPKVSTSKLFRLADGKLMPITSKLDAEPKFTWFDRSIVETETGFWIVADEGRVVFVSFPDKETILHDLNWKSGLPLQHPRQLSITGDKHLVALDLRTGQSCLIPTDYKAEVIEEAPRLDLLETRSLLIENSRGEIFGILGDGAFTVWRDEQWNDWKVPAEVKKFTLPTLGISEHDTVWVISESDGHTAVCNTRSGDWKVYENLEAALVAKLAPSSRIDRGAYTSVQPFSSHHDPPRIAYLNGTGHFHFYDSKKWTSSKISEIAGADARVTGTPFFDDSGAPFIPIDRRLYRSENGKDWTQEGKAHSDVEPTYRRTGSDIPPNCPVENISSSIYDKQGVCWMIDKSGAIWKGLPGSAIALIEPGSPNPVINGATFHRVSTDHKGNAFISLEFGDNAGKHLSIRARHPFSASTSELKGIKEDAATIRFGEAPWHRWRTDDGDWSPASQDREQSIVGLRPGDHEIEVLAYNAELTPAIESATVKVSITSLKAPMIKKLLSQISEGNLENRELAVRKLRSQGPPIIPRLQDAQASAGDPGKWWIEALIQRIREDAAKGKSSTQ